MELGVIIPFIFAIIVLYIILKILAFPMKVIIKLVINAIVGGLLIALINYIGVGFGFTLILTWWSAILVGFLGIPGVILLAILGIFI